MLQSMGANGLTLANYDPFVDAVGTLADANETANGGIIVAWWRGDIAVARAAAFAVIVGIR